MNDPTNGPARPDPTDPSDPTGDRAERALRRAFSTHADAVDPTPIDPALLLARLHEAAGATADDEPAPENHPRLTAATARDDREGESAITGGRRRRPAAWWPIAAAVAAVALGVPIAFGLGGALIGAPSAARNAASEVVPAAAPEDAAGSRPANGTTESSLDQGTRTVSFLDVVVDVPSGWGYDFAPGPDWCAATGVPRPDGPYVDRNPLSRVTHDILCTGTVPDEAQQTHLTWRRLEPGDAAASASAGAWATVSKPVGSAYVSVTVPAGEERIARDVLASARVVDVDPRGCPVRLPEGRPADGALEDLAGAAAASVCQYVVGDTQAAGLPDLVGSYELDGEEADALFRMITGGVLWADTVGEDLECSPTGDVLLARFTDAADAVRTARFSLSDGCGFGWYDGVSAYPPSRATCGDLLVGQLWVATTDERWAAPCQPR